MPSLYAYQRKYLEDFPPRGIMAAELGTGKTPMSLMHYNRYRSERPLLILAPASKIRTGDWQRDVEEWLGGNLPTYEVYSYEKFSRGIFWHKFSPKYGGIQYDIIADECHRIANPQSQQGKALYKCAKDAPFFIGLSGTPTPNGWISFANYSKIFDFTKNITEFKRTYCDYIDVGFPKLVGYKNEDTLKLQWQAISKRLTRAEATELPEKILIAKDFELNSMYKRVLKTRMTDNGEMLDNASKFSHALRQLLIEPKIPFISDLISSTDENVILFYNYESERLALLEMLKKHSEKYVFEQNGHAHEIPKKKDWGQVHNSVTLAHYKSGGTGVELTYATITIFVSPTYSYSEYAQSIGRTFRNGQTSKTLFYFLRTKNSIEESVYKCLKSKNDFSEKQWIKSL